MLWTGIFLTLILIALYSLDLRRTVLVSVIAGILLVLGNALRVASLFYLETSIVKSLPFLHDMVGLVVFAFTAGTIVWVVQKITGRNPCERCST